MPIGKLVELNGEYGGWLEIDPVRLKRTATAFKAWLMTLDPNNDPFCFLKWDLPLVESALDGTMQLPFYDSPHNWESREGLLPGDYCHVSSPFYNTVAGALYKPPEVIMKDGRYYAWAEFEDPEDSGASETPASETPASETPASETPASETPASETPASETPASETPASETSGLNSGIQMILGFMKIIQPKWEALAQKRGDDMPIRKLVELYEHDGSLEIDPVKLKRTATAFKAWLMTLDPDNDPFCFLKQDLPLVEAALDGTMQLPFYDRPRTWGIREGLLPEIYHDFSAPFYLMASAAICTPDDDPYKPTEVIMKGCRYYAWAEFEAPEDSWFSEKMVGIRLWLNSRIQKILGLEALMQRRRTKKGIRKLVELNGEYGASLEIDPVRLKRTATAFKAWLMTLDPDNDLLGFLKKDLPLVESALDGTMQLPFYDDPQVWAGREYLLPKRYYDFAAPFYSTAAGVLRPVDDDAFYEPSEVIMKDGRYYTWAKFEEPEDSWFSEKIPDITFGLNSWIQKILGFLNLKPRKKMLGNLEKSRLNHLKAIDRTRIFISSGSTLPVATRLDITDTLVKVVPAGSQPSPRTGYWLRPSELADLKKDPANMANKLSFPPRLHADQFDVYEIAPNKQGVVVFESIIAPTTFNGVLNTSGGATQTIVVNRDLFTLPTKIGSIDAKKRNESIRKLVELNGEHDGWLEIDPVKLKRTATAFKAWLMTLDPDNDPFDFLKQDLPLVESALDGTMQLPFYDQPHKLEIRKCLLPDRYHDFAVPFYSTAAGILYGSPEVIMKNGLYYAWAEFEDPEDAGAFETPGLNSMIQKIPGFLKRLG